MTARGNEPAPGLRGRFRFVALIDPGLALRVHVRGSSRNLLGRLVDDLRLSLPETMEIVVENAFVAQGDEWKVFIGVEEPPCHPQWDPSSTPTRG